MRGLAGSLTGGLTSGLTSGLSEILRHRAVAPCFKHDFAHRAHAIRFFEAALFDLDPWGTLAREALWLLGLTLVFATAARIGVRRLLT